MKEFEKLLEKNSKKYSKSEVFHDFIRMAAISYSQSLDYRQDREDEYLRTIKKYKKEEQLRFSEMLGLLILEFEKRPRDVLGELYMSMELGNDDAGQFFTPYHISAMMVELMDNKEYPDDEVIVLEEPSCGAGGMIIAYANMLKMKSINFQERLLVRAKDLDARVVYMTYLQMAIMGIPGVVIHGDSLTGEAYDRWYTPFYAKARLKQLKEKAA